MKSIVAFMLLLASLSAAAQTTRTVVLEMEPVTVREDGTAITDPVTYWGRCGTQTGGPYTRLAASAAQPLVEMPIPDGVAPETLRCVAQAEVGGLLSAASPEVRPMFPPNVPGGVRAWIRLNVQIEVGQ